MPASELLLLHGLDGLGGRKMPQRTGSYTTYFDAPSGMYVQRSRRKRRARKVSGLGSLGSFGQARGLKGTLSSVKGVLITGAIAAAGAIVTDQVYEKIGASLGLEGWKRDAAKIATGIALGILIAKFLKKPRLAAAFAIGPVVAGALNIFGDVMSGGTSGLGLTSFAPVSAYDSMYSPLYGANQVGSVNTYEPVEAPGLFAPPPPLSGYYSMPG